MQTAASPTRSTLDGLFPRGVVSVLSLDPAEAGPLAPEEAAATGRFVAKRLEEFRHGRDCARRALFRLGVAPVGVPVGASREPLWPAGVVGSISHSGRIAAAAVAKAADYAGIGLDLEPVEPLEAALVARICRPAELTDCADEAAAGTRARLLFTIKEAAYKALWPTLRVVLDFHDLEVRLALNDGGWAIESRATVLPDALAGAVSGRYGMREGLCIAAATLPAARAG